MNIDELKFDPDTGLIPAIVQDAQTQKVLMFAYMNRDSIRETLSSGKVTFYSRSKGRLWTKGETSKNFLHFISLKPDCDLDALLVTAQPTGPVCHTGTDTCWGEENTGHALDFLLRLEQIVEDRKERPKEGSYTSDLFARGLNKIAQKLGEEAVELIIESKDQKQNLFLNESADLLFHLLILLKEKNSRLQDVVDVLRQREK